MAEPQPLTAEVVAHNRFNWASRVDINEVNRTLSVFPGRSVWIPNADEVVIVAPWRNREEIAAVAQLSAIRRLDDLLDAARQASFAHGAEAFVIPEWNETRDPRFYQRNGLDLLEEVISFECGTEQSRPEDLRRGSPEKVETMDSPLLGQICSMDQLAFPWLWRNSRLEFEHYLLSPGVELWALHDAAHEPVGYAGITSYAGWGHLDRIAVAPDRQGEGHGETAVRFAIARLRQLGAKQIGLSTQRSNLRSQRLYARVGFRPSRQNDYRIYGTLGPTAPGEARSEIGDIGRS